MSQFLPEGFGQTPPSGVADITPPDPETTAADIALMQRVLSAASRNPNLIPADFMAYVLDWIQTQRLQTPIGQVIGYTRDQRAFGLTPGQGPDITAASTITVSHWSHRISGATTIDNIAGGVEGAIVRLICESSISISSVGNIWATGAGGTRTVPAQAAVTLTYNITNFAWHVSGVGS